MDVLFCTQIDYSFGEREHAVCFARQIEKAGFRPRFAAAHERIADHIRLAGFESAVFSSPDELSHIIEEVDPALVIGCELFNLASVLVKRMIASGRPVGTMDGTTLGREINNDPFRGPEFRRQMVLPERFYAFRPCPVNDIAPNTEDIFYWRLLPEMSRAPKDEAVYGALGLDPGLRTVMLAIAPWALGGARYFGLQGYHDKLLARIVDGLAASGERLQFVVVANHEPQSSSQGTVDARILGLLRHDLYDHLLRSCDMILSDNIIQNSVSKAVVMGIPHLIIQNMPSAWSATPTGEGGRLAPELPYRCNIFPVKQVFPKEREYARIVDVAEYVDPMEIREKLVTILRQGYFDPERRRRRAEYVARLDQLSDAGDVLRGLLGTPRASTTSLGRPS